MVEDVEVRFLSGINLTTALGGLSLIILSLWPGYASGLMLCLALPAILLLGIMWLGAVSQLWTAFREKPLHAFPLRPLLVVPFLVCLTYGLLRFYVPRRISFAACQSQFDACIASAPVKGEGVPLGRRLGLYWVDQWAADPRGGVYFRTATCGAGIGPDRLSFGFVYRPNRAGTPFGESKYVVHPLTQDWYWFEVLD